MREIFLQFKRLHGLFNRRRQETAMVRGPLQVESIPIIIHEDTPTGRERRVTSVGERISARQQTPPS